ncbi:MAG: NUDIX domain-containing protein [Hyphomicrobiales bacterium]
MTANKPILGVSCLLLCEDSALLIQRAKQPAKGLWSLPGGKVEWGETLEEAARRELLEETALIADDLEFSEFVEIVEPDHHFVISVFVGRLSNQPTPTAGDDAAAAAWYSPAGLNKLDDANQMTPTTRQRIKRLTKIF